MDCPNCDGVMNTCDSGEPYYFDGYWCEWCLEWWDAEDLEEEDE